MAIKINTDIIYPIGSLYESVNSTNPSTFFGGTWELISSTEERSLITGNNPSSAYKNSWTTNCTITLQPGTYIVWGYASTSGSGQGRTIRLTATNGTPEIRQSIHNSDGNVYSANIVNVYKITSAATVSLQSWSAASGTWQSIGMLAYRIDNDFKNGIYVWRRTA